MQVDENTSIKKARATIEDCQEEIDILKLQFDKMSDKQTELNRIAEEKRKIMKSIPVLQEEKKIEKPKDVVLT